MSSQHQTTVTVKNPSGDTPLRVSLQGSSPYKAKKFYAFTDEPGVTSVRPNSLVSIGGGQFDSGSEGEGKTGDRRFTLVGPGVIEVTARDGNLIAEELELVNYDTGITWEVKATLAPPRAGVKYEIAPETRVSFRADPKANTEGMFINIRTGDGAVQIIMQVEHEYWSARAAAWAGSAPAGDVAPGTSRPFTISDSSRLVIETDSEKDITLTFENRNILHSLRLLNLDTEGKETPVATIGHGQSGYVNNGANAIFAPGLNLQTGQVNTRKGLLAIIQQQPT